MDDNKVELVKQGKDYIQYQLVSESSGWFTRKQEMDDTIKKIDPILKEWGIKHYYFHHVYLYVITDEFYNEIYKIFKGLSRRKLVNNTYQYLMTKNLKYYIYIDGEEMKIASNIEKYLLSKYGITWSQLYDILEEVICPMYKLDYMSVRTMNDQFMKSKNGIWYYQPEFDK